ncbi:bifunctional diguanylate cyclase/phosphodiesterase [Nocardioides sp. CER19]|uniref:putative bifunctional diguanylate cyclase/phosphodiesterase n=1 Tax=Nocardioides sp. CER19 TaxID=3038538 RepID=UPI00244B45B9|nr:bifunctional diguanylate cyclase/phosphodiesterase [Nocardioides sp. CER19]MDH2415603.1 bifunctional diguanylate cyclase/phosphodiesterase [Nocardioides sp. CER19]
MDAPSRRPGSTARLLLTHGALILVPVILLGVALSLGIRGTAESRGLAEARSEALLVAQTAIVPQLDGRPLSEGLSTRERRVMERLVGRAVADGHLLRVRLRDEHGAVVFSDADTNGAAAAPAPVEDEEDEVADATAGHVVAKLTHVNADSDDVGPVGPAAVEVYLPLTAGEPARSVGVLETYLPYAPIEADVTASVRALYRDLGLGLAGLFVVLLVITISVSRGLRRELATNAWLARHDALTDLPNRARFVEKVREAAAWAGRTGRPAVVALMDLDHFKDLNDTLGHPSGDELLIKLARRLEANVDHPGTVARLGGDEFGIVLRDVRDGRAELADLAALVAVEVDVSGLPLSVAPSIGYVTVPDALTSAEQLMQHAEVAMYAAKADHTVVVEYRPELEHFVAADVELIAEMPKGLESGQFRLHYQPQLDAASGTVVGAEALVRWQHPVHGLLPPGRFLPMAEQTDLIERLTDWVLATALADASRLALQGTPIPISVNVSARSVVREDFAEQVIGALEEADVSAAQLVVEVTETALLTNPGRARAILSTLDQAGVHVSIDDFGQGQTSLGYLSDLPIRELKIDRGFITGMTGDQARTAIVQSVIDLGHNLGMRVVAEGIETGADLDAVRGLGCDLAQGYHLGRPMELVALTERLGAPQPAVD